MVQNIAELPDDEAEVAREHLDDLRHDIPGAKAQSPFHFTWRAWVAVLKRVWVMNGFHNLALLAAGVAFYTFLAFVPMIAATVLLYGLLANPEDVVNSMNQLSDIAPPEVVQVLQDQLLSIVTTNASVQGIGLIVALAIAIFGAMRAATAIMQALNIIYEEHESRNIARFYGTSALITVGFVATGIFGVAAVSAFSYVQIALSDTLGAGTEFLMKLLTWGLAGTLVSATFAVIYRYAPDRRNARWSWLTTGSITATLLWLAGTLGFGLYASNFTDYNATYGSLAAVVIFQMWLFVSAYAVLLGGEVNAETERQTLVDSTIGPDRPIGERGAAIADSVALDDAQNAVLKKRQARRSQRDARRAARKAG